MGVRGRSIVRCFRHQPHLHYFVVQHSTIKWLFWQYKILKNICIQLNFLGRIQIRGCLSGAVNYMSNLISYCGCSFVYMEIYGLILFLFSLGAYSPMRILNNRQWEGYFLFTGFLIIAVLSIRFLHLFYFRL